MHQLVTVQKQMYIPAQNSDVSVSNYFETVLRSNRLIPKASLTVPPASYLPCSLAAPLLLIINLSLQGECFGKHPPTVAGRCCGARRGIREQSPESRSARRNMMFGGCCMSSKELSLKSHQRQGKKKISLIRPSYSKCHSMLDPICNRIVTGRTDDAFRYSCT